MRPPSPPRALVPILVGVTCGLAYSVLSQLFHTTFTPTGTLEVFHELVDWGLPPLAGMFFGLVVSLVQQTRATAHANARAVDELTHRLAGTEREQAVWVLASSVLHELRNPLHTLGLALEELEQRAPGDDAVLEEARAAVTRVASGFSELRGFAAGPVLRAEAFSLSQLAREVTSDLAPLAHRAGLTLTVEAQTERLALGDRRLARTAIENLVSNALDALREAHGSRVTVRVEATDTHAELVVQDDGPGIPDARTAEVWEPLRSSKGPKGLGLGLPIARALCRAQGGDVTLRSGAPGATAFAVVLPLASDAATDPARRG